MSVINIQEKLKLFSDLWSPKKVGELNGQQILLAKVKGEFVFHKHEFEDELFMVIKGVLEIELRDKTITLKEVNFILFQKVWNTNQLQKKKCISYYLNHFP